MSNLNSSGVSRSNVGLLTGVTVIEWGESISVPMCGRFLADLGADVIKVEQPQGDVARRVPPFVRGHRGPEASALFQHLNLGKRGVTLDVSSTAGRGSLHRLLDRANLLIMGQRPRDLDAWGFDLASLAKRHPHLSVVSVTPFGLTGPYRDWVGADLVVWAMSGYAMLNPRQVGDPELPPLRLPGGGADNMAAAFACAASSVVLLQQQRTGRGAHVDVSALDALAAIHHVRLGQWQAAGGYEPRLAATTGRPITIPWGLFQCKDGWVGVFVVQDNQWKGLVKAMGSPEWATPELFANYQGRATHFIDVLPLFQAWLMEHTMQEVFEVCQANAAPACAVLTFKDVASSQQFLDRKAWQKMRHPGLGTIPVLRPPYLTPGVQWKPARPAPRLGEHNREVLGATARTRLVSQGRGSTIKSLAGFRVLELGAAIAAPYLAMVMAELGADVIKIETQKRPDSMRYTLPLDPSPSNLDGGHVFNQVNRNKMDVTLNLDTAEGKRLLLDLVETADVVVDNYSAGTMPNFGLGYEVLRRRRPDIVMVSLSGFGDSGPLRDCVAYGIVLEGMAGMLSVQGYEGGRPIETPLTYNDYVSAMLGIQLITAALYRRMETGEGFYADFAEAEVTLHVLLQGIFDWMINGRNQVRQGNADEFHPIHNCFRCAGDDKWVAIVAGAGEEWPRLCRAIGREGWLWDPRLATREGRMACRGELEAALREWARTRTAIEASATLQRHGVPAGPAYQIDELLNDPQVRARGVFRKDGVHPYTGHRIVPAPSLRVEGVPVEMGRAPLWKEHNGEVFGSLLGVPAAEVKRLEQTGVVA